MKLVLDQLMISKYPQTPYKLQVHGRKGFPHVVYGKLWRFNEMTKNETRHVDHCKHAFEMKSDMVGEVSVNCFIFPLM